MYKWLFCDSVIGFKYVKLQGARHSRLHLLVKKAHCCVQQGSILPIPQSASSITVISIFAVKEQTVVLNYSSVAQYLL